MLKSIKIFSVFLFVLLFPVMLSTNVAFAQLGSLKNLKTLTQQVNDINKSVHPGDPWTVKNIITPDELLNELKGKNKPLVLQVGFEILYKQGHIKGAEFAGPAFRENGISKIKSAVKNVPHNKEIVIYCGCCGWTDCPNIHPAFALLKKMGYTNLKLLYLPDNFTKDWVNKGLPVE